MSVKTDRFQQALEDLRSSLNSNRLAQAYLVVGSPQGDALKFAEQLLLSLYCTGEDDACGACRECRTVSRRSHPDIQWIEPQKKSRRIVIEQIRELEEYVYRTSFAGGWKAGVLIDADRIGVEAANAFLKTLEEPPAGCLFLLLARNAHALPATVVSRCQRVVLSSEADALPEEWREPLLNMLTQAGGPSPTSRAAMSSRIQSLLEVIHDKVETEVAESLEDESREETKDTVTARVEARYKMYRSTVLQTILLWQRDVLLHVCESPQDALHFQDRRADTARQASDLAYRTAMQRVQAIGRIDSLLESNLPEAAVLRTAFRH
jgi:DNA polymerase-3 subunit delta'